MDYISWAQEYYSAAENLLKTIKKYQEQLKQEGVINRQYLNSKIKTYKNIYNDLRKIGNALSARAQGNFYEA